MSIRSVPPRPRDVYAFSGEGDRRRCGRGRLALLVLGILGYGECLGIG